MSSIKEEILSCLKQIKGGGKFASIQVENFVFPGLVVNGLGEISYPINGIQASALIQVAHKAPFGKGIETIVDSTVRSAWEIDAPQLNFKGAQWDAFLNHAISKVKENLGLEGYTVSASLYKLLIYEEGDFFLPHKDSEKEKGMFGTMVITFPSQYTGGELLVTFDGMEEIADFSTASSEYKLGVAAFYADCDHEIKPLKSGHRVCLVYNLVQQSLAKKIEHSSIAGYAIQLAEQFKKVPEHSHTEPFIVLLGHQYTPENFSYNALKLNDRPKAEALIRAASLAGCYAKLCLVTSFRTGSPEYDGYHDEDDENAEMAEVNDEWLAIEHWAKDEIPVLNSIHFQEEDLIVPFTLNEGEPIIKESTGYMGNYGPDLNHWYHYGAVMVWTKKANAALVLTQDTASRLAWLQYFSENLQKTSDGEIAAIETVLVQGIENGANSKNENYNAIANWVIARKNVRFFERVSEDVLRYYFIQIEAVYWLKIFSFISESGADGLITKVVQHADKPVIEKLVAILRTVLEDGRFMGLALQHTEKLPQYLDLMAKKPKADVVLLNSAALQNLFWIDNKTKHLQTWATALAAIIAGHKKRKYINHVLVPEMLAVKEPSHLLQQLLLLCKAHLEHIAGNQPQAPANWAKPVPESGGQYKKQWGILQAFLESPTETVFDYRKNQNERVELESAILNTVVDLKTETIRKGSPHTLRITKTQAAYLKSMKEWNEDMVLLQKITDRLGVRT